MLRTLLSAVKWRILSFPIFLKIIGIGLLTAVLFGAVTLWQTRSTTSEILYQLLEQKTISMGRSIADTIERSASTADYYSIRLHLKEAQKAFPEIRYLIVRDRNNSITASTFEKGVPPDLIKLSSPQCPPQCKAQTIGSGENSIMDIRFPVAGGFAGSVQIGVLDTIVLHELDTLTGKVLWALLLCATIGIVYALMLTGIMTRPIHHLVQAANSIREGNFETRATVFSNDEIGRLAVAFNQMAEGLLQYREEVQAKEKARLLLIERIVQIQEDERKIISRELHDHFGQSLLALLMQVQSGCEFKSAKCESAALTGSLCFNIENTIRQMIEEVHRLAWGMRPSILDDYGLESALARHIEEASKTTGLEIDYQFIAPKGLARLPISVELSLFRIAQEATANIIKHAKASHASFVVLRQLHEVTMIVEDNGQGFDFAAVSKRGDQCLGLMGMRERVNLLGASFVIESAPGEGTTISIRIPLGEDSNANTDLHSG
jgi:signal transduction histidine kinase